MDKSVMFLQSVLVLLVAIQVTSACEKCPGLSFHKAMCPENRKTVVLALVRGKQLLDAAGNVVDNETKAFEAKYEMAREIIFKEGPNTLFLDDFTFHMILPLNNELCSYRLEVDKAHLLFIIIGDVDTDGILHSNVCQVVLSTPSIRKDEEIMDVLFGIRTPSCGRGDC